MCSDMHDRPPTGQLTPFGHPRIAGCLLLPVAFRSLPRPSSPGSSKASTVDPYSLDHVLFLSFSHTGCPHSASTRQAASQTPGAHAPQLPVSPWCLFTHGRFAAELALHRLCCQRPPLTPPRFNAGVWPMEARGFEPLTYGLQSHRSRQLSYAPGLYPVTTANSRSGTKFPEQLQRRLR